MGSREEKEAAINAKIAAIRAANEARERRHREVEADRLEAEKSKSAVGPKPKNDEEVEFKNPFEEKNRKKQPRKRPEEISKELPRQTRGRSRLADDDGPPPDPGYSFLADRMRDGSPSSQEESKKTKQRPMAKKAGEPRELREPRQGGRSFNQQDENVSPKHRSKKIEERVAANIRDIREETSKIKPLMPQKSNAQARLDRSRKDQQAASASVENGSDQNFGSDAYNPNRQVSMESKKNITVKVNFDSPSHQEEPPKIEQPPSMLPPTPLVASTPSWNPTPTENWSQYNSGWEQPQQTQNQMVIGHWENPNAAAAAAVGWSQPMTDWSAAPDYHHHPQYVHIPYQEPASPMMIPMGQEYLAHPPLVQHTHPQAMTQITHATMPIMATQQYIPPVQNRDFRYRNSRNSTNWRNPDKEVTRIPPRFQKQRPAPLAQYQASEKVQSLPRATSRTAPSTSKRLTIFGTSNVVNNLTESQLSESLNIPVRLIPAMKLEVFKEKIAMVDPLEDRLVLIHGLGNDARNIALKQNKTDVDKGAESDGLANEFAQVVLDLIERIPYIKVFISTLLPRFDNEDQMNMSNPNNVRKVMNVEISMKLQDKSNIEFINNDTVLEWWKDDVKKHRLFTSDGYHLSAYGFSMMLEHWMKTLKCSVSKMGLVSDEDSATPEGDDEIPNLEEVTPKMAQVKIDEQVPLPSATSDEEEFHEASESPVEKPPTESTKTEDEEFKEKSNEEKMEKEMKEEEKPC